MQRGKVGGSYLALGKEETLLTLSPVLALETQIYPFRLPFSRLTPGKLQGLPLLTSRLNWMHEPVHLDIPVFHVGTGLAQLPLGSLWGAEPVGVGQRHSPRQGVYFFRFTDPLASDKGYDHFRKTHVCSQRVMYMHRVGVQFQGTHRHSPKG